MSCCSTVCCATARHFDQVQAREELESYHDSGPGQTTRRLLAALRQAEAAGDLLDIGSGIGVLSLELLKSGLITATCVDMSGEALLVGEAEARRQGVSDRMTWREGDFVELAPGLPVADVVTLDRVVCCYPAYRPLLEEAARHARRLIAMSYPRDRWFVKLVLRGENLWRRVRGDAFRAFVHPTAAMDEVMRQAGFAAISRDATLAWETTVYARSG